MFTVPVSKAQQKATAKYRKENYDQLKVEGKKGRKDVIQQHAIVYDKSLNAFVNRAIEETMERDTKKDSE